MKKSFTKYISKQFAKPSGIGGLLSTFIMNRMNQKQYKAVLKNLDINPSNKILDIGFGNGYLIKRILKQKPTQVSGIEISEDMLNKVSNRLKSAISENKLELSLADIKDLPFAENTFDKICTVNTFYFWTDYEASFAQIKRVLKHEGLFINAIYTKEWLEKSPFTKYNFSINTIDQIVEMSEKSGLKVIDIIEIEKGISFCIITKKI